MSDKNTISTNERLILSFFSSKTVFCQVPVAHVCILSYSRGKEQEDYRQTVTPYLKNTQHVKGLVEWLKV
jgi:hypothetical protein